ncbi:MAG: hypothetical protein KAU94_04520 [Verrucomicrobia bacterium]|nr:hypothetical protein [Verrucomicrobiota bacterium]
MKPPFKQKGKNGEQGDYIWGVVFTAFRYRHFGRILSIPRKFRVGLGRWGPDATSDFDWSWHSGPTGSWYTGPSGAHDRDWYVYTEASYPNYGGKTAILEAEFDISSPAEPMISFRYHMFGGNMGTLRLEVYNEQYSFWETQWSKSSSTHSSYDDPWTRKEFVL